MGLDIHAAHPIQRAQPFDRGSCEPIGHIIALVFEADFAGDFDHVPVFQEQARDATQNEGKPKGQESSGLQPMHSGRS